MARRLKQFALSLEPSLMEEAKTLTFCLGSDEPTFGPKADLQR
jgi:hypothetical protein